MYCMSVCNRVDGFNRAIQPLRIWILGKMNENYLLTFYPYLKDNIFINYNCHGHNFVLQKLYFVNNQSLTPEYSRFICTKR